MWARPANNSQRVIRLDYQDFVWAHAGIKIPTLVLRKFNAVGLYAHLMPTVIARPVAVHVRFKQISVFYCSTITNRQRIIVYDWA